MTAPIIKFRIEKALISSKRSRQRDAAPFTGGFSWGHFRNAPGRVSFADELVSLSHTGWFLDSHQDGKARGIVVRLPRGRFLAGIELDSRGVSECALQMFDSAEDAAHDADEQARIYAEAEFEYNEAWQEGVILSDAIEKKKNDVVELFSARHNKRVRSDIRETVADIRAFEVEFKDLCARHGLEY